MFIKWLPSACTNHELIILKIPLYLLLFLLVSLGSSGYGQELVGTYESENPGLIKKGWLYFVGGYKGLLAGTELQLQADSSFQMTTCANLLTGHWYASQDTLYLEYETNRWRIDSLQEHGFNGKWPTVGKGYQKVKYKGDKLIFHSTTQEDEKLYDVLVKVKESAQR